MENLDNINDLDSLAKVIIKEINCDYFFICEIQNYRVSIPHCSYQRLEKMENKSYDLELTPCYVSSLTGTGFYPKKVQDYFPLDKFFKVYNVNAYVGIGVHRGNEFRACGLLSALFKNDIENGTEVLETLKKYEEKAIELLDKKLQLNPS